MGKVDPNGKGLTLRQVPKGDPAGETRDSAQSQGDRLELSSDARAYRGGGSVQQNVTSQDTTTQLSLSPTLQLGVREVYGSGTMLDGGILTKLDWQAGPQTTFVAGAGYLPGFYKNAVSSNNLVPRPQAVGFVGVGDVRTKQWDIGAGTSLSLSLKTFGVQTLSSSIRNGWHIDQLTSTGLAKITETGEAAVSKQLGESTVYVGYGQHLDGEGTYTYYETGGKGLFPLSHFALGGVDGPVGPVRLGAEVYLPVHTATNDFASDPRLRLNARAPDLAPLPDLSVTASSKGIERLGLAKTWRLSRQLEAGVSASAEQLFSAHPNYGFEAGVRFGFGGTRHQAGQPPVTPHYPDYRRASVTHGPRRSDIPCVDPKLEDYFTPDQITQMQGRPIEELAKSLKTPEQVTAYVGRFVKYDWPRAQNSHGDDGSMTPAQVALLLRGICRDQHPFIVTELGMASGVEGETTAYYSPETSHAIALYRDPATKRWNVIEYGRIYYTQADSADDAFLEVRPDALSFSHWSSQGPNQKGHKLDINYTETAREFQRFVDPFQDGLGAR